MEENRFCGYFPFSVEGKSQTIVEGSVLFSRGREDEWTQLSRKLKDLQPGSGENAEEVLHLPPQQPKSLYEFWFQRGRDRGLDLGKQGWRRNRRDTNAHGHCVPFANRVAWEGILPGYPASCRLDVKLAQQSQLGNCHPKQLSLVFPKVGFLETPSH